MHDQPNFLWEVRAYFTLEVLRGKRMTHQPNENPFMPDAVIQIQRTASGEAARSLALTMTDEELKAECERISQRDFNEPFQPDKYPWLDGSRDGMIDFIVGSYLP